jgi:hypothetical protein
MVVWRRMAKEQVRSPRDGPAMAYVFTVLSAVG